MSRYRFDAGPGDHTDEASSALEDLEGEVPVDVLATLAKASGEAVPERSNPSRKKKAKGKPAAVLPIHESLYTAMLVTGAWGPDPRQPVLDGSFQARRHLPLVLKEAPQGRAQILDRTIGKMSALRLEAPFRERMATLEVELRRQLGIVMARRAPQWTEQIGLMLRAVRYAKTATSVFRGEDPLGLPPNRADGGWNPVVMGNKKLNFAAYSELPMATCPGAGACGLPMRAGPREIKAPVGTRWCYSFKAYQHPHAWSRMFLSTLANELDRHLAREAGGDLMAGEIASVGGETWAHRVRAGMLTRHLRVWPRYVLKLALEATAVGRSKGTQFLRLFVDGDIGAPDDVAAWMDAVRAAGPKNLEVYGYSKAWRSFEALDKWYTRHGDTWPTNYTLNMSSGSVYEGESSEDLRAHIASLPIVRGTFQAVPFKSGKIEKYLPELIAQARALKAAEAASGSSRAVVPMPRYDDGTMAIDPHRVMVFTLLSDAQNEADVTHAFASIKHKPRIAWEKEKKLTPERVRWLGYQELFRYLANEPTFGARVRAELKRDKKPLTEQNVLQEYEALQRQELRRAFGALAEDTKVPKKIRDKTLALAAHEALWSLDVGGSCPLVCGNCSDHPSDPTKGVHRCASKVTFKGKTINIGLH